MKKKDLFKFNAVIFGLVVLVHLIRLIFGWELKLSTWMAPMYISGIAILLAGFLCWENWHAK